MTTTPHGQVPAIQRYKIGYHSDEWGVRSLSPIGIYDDAGPWVLYKDHIAALRTQQQECGNTPYDEGPFALAQPVAQQGAASEPTPPKSEELRALSDRYWGREDLRDAHAAGVACGFALGVRALRAQQPAPATQQAGWTNADADAARLALPEITVEDRLLLHYNPNTGDIVKWVRNYARAAITADRAARTQVDSVTAPAGGGAAGPEWKWVPVDATDAMVRATDKVNFENEDTDGTIHNVWNTMLAAAPTPPTSAEGVGHG